MAGRPTKLTPEITKTITDAIAIGATYQAAAEYAGISLSTFNLWLAHKGKMYREFSEAVRQANSRAQIQLLTEIQKADDWRSKAWILERRFPDSYGQVVKFGKMSDDELRAYITGQLEKLGAGDGGSGTARFADSTAALATDPDRAD